MVFLGCYDGYLQELSMISETTVHNFGRILYENICSMAKTSDNKSQLLCDLDGRFKELDISKRKQIKSFPVKSSRYCVVTCDNKFLITVKD